MPFPLIKLGYLLLKQLSKPLALSIKSRAKASPFFRKYVCMPPAQIYNRFEVNFRLRQMGLGKVKNVEPLNDKQAIDLGGDMLGEILVFTFGALILVSEYSRSANKEQAKEEQRSGEMQRLSNKVIELKTISEIQESQIKDLQRYIDLLVIANKDKSPPSTSSENDEVKKSPSSPGWKIFGS